MDPIAASPTMVGAFITAFLSLISVVVWALRMQLNQSKKLIEETIPELQKAFIERNERLGALYVEQMDKERAANAERMDAARDAHEKEQDEERDVFREEVAAQRTFFLDQLALLRVAITEGRTAPPAILPPPSRTRRTAPVIEASHSPSLPPSLPPVEPTA